eukprot:CAMPEP_0196657478 /NCGR_PEP_ID=MMETSP1086-20130531/23636_1 /TAXON_ID=77921 /ORGANISM="Cyanoptyche  gloeocystis , Strain SAG4.97" /LENGTH=124 /DNA_ID=CAMNT_0041990619 /DNA_START=153 /DNA_END=528 /DNA_ORIENTATION=+
MLRRHVTTVGADDDREFRLVVDLGFLGGYFRNNDGVARVLHSGKVFHEDHWVLWDFLLRLCGMVAVVEPDAENATGEIGLRSFLTVTGEVRNSAEASHMEPLISGNAEDNVREEEGTDASTGMP